MITIELKTIENESGLKLFEFTYSFKMASRSGMHENAIEAIINSGYVKTVKEAQVVFNKLNRPSTARTVHHNSGLK